MSESSGLICADVNVYYGECDSEKKFQESNDGPKDIKQKEQNEPHKNNEFDNDTNIFTNKDKELSQKDENSENNNRHQNLLRIIDTDSEDENMLISNSKRRKRVHNIIKDDNSDSNDETTNSKHDVNFKRHSNHKSHAKKSFNSESDDSSSKNNDNIKKKVLESDTVPNSIQHKLHTLADSIPQEEMKDEDQPNSVENNEDKDKERKAEHCKSNMKKVQNKLQTLVDSESEDEVKDEDKETTAEHCKSVMREVQNKLQTLVDSESEEEVKDEDKETTTEHCKSNMKKIQNKLQTLVDSESEDEMEDENESSSEGTEKIKDKGKEGEHRKSNMRKVSLVASKEETMKQIKSETQRLVREKEVCLPYHRPKQRTLQEFLSRKKVLTALPKTTTMAAKLKLSSAIVDEVLKEKEKEAEIFYKSSDSEEETSENHSSSNKENTNAESAQNNKSHISRRLFVNDDLCTDDDTEENCLSTVQKKCEFNKSIVDDAVKVNANDSIILKSHSEFNNTENTNEDDSVVTEPSTKSDNINDLLQESKEMCINNTIDTSKSVNEPSTSGGSNVNDDYASIVRRSLGIHADESDEYNEYGLPPFALDDSPIIEKKKMLSDIQSLKPKLRGKPGTMIDLSDSSKSNKGGINSLINRFVWKHSKPTGCSNDTLNVKTTHIKENPNGVSIVKETFPYKLPNIADEDPKLKKPGAKLMRLKEELKNKMAMKRDEEWKQKEQETKDHEIEWNESINEEDNFSEPCSPSIESYKSKEDELLEENDLCEKVEKKRSKCDFLDDEAEISEDETNDSNDIIDEDEFQENDKGESDMLDTEAESENSNDADVSLKHKTFKRILTTLEDDIESGNIEDVEHSISNDRYTSSQMTQSRDIFEGSTNENNKFSDNESDIPVSQVPAENDSSNQPSLTPQTKNRFSFVSPVIQLTALNACLNSAKKSDDVGQNLFAETDFLPIESTQSEDASQVCDLQNRVISHKKLFADHSEPLESNVTESQLLDVCSGTFGTQIDNSRESLSHFSDEKSQNQKQSEAKRQKPWNKLNLVSSDEEDSIKEVKYQSKKRVKKLDLSDDEEEDASSIASEDVDDKEDEEKFVDYDSEENEVVVAKKDIKQYASKFLDEEAELSESDCDVSADEDEQDLDKLELEEGDNEEIDDIQTKSQLDKFHMKQILDEDQKEVRMLQELLFEEGDLFSESNRERKFKWKNIDKQENTQLQPREDKDGWVDLSDDEDEVKWRKLRHEREKFLAEKTENVNTEIENDLNDSQIFKFGMKILKKRRITESQKQDTLLETLDTKADSRIPHTIAEMLNSPHLGGKSRTIHSIMQKRSFLAKGEESLARLATMAKQRDAPLPTMNAKNFVFAHINPSTENEDLSIVGTDAEQFKLKKNH